MSKKRLLVVDDEDKARQIVRLMLADTDYEIVGEAYDGDEALDLYRITKPDIVLLDIMMPKFDGIKGLQDILKLDPKAKVVMLTALTGKEFIVKTIKAGACDYLDKPFRKADILAVLDKALAE